MRIIMAAILLPLTLSGCIAKTAVDLVTLPVKVASGAVDAVTTSQSEADENLGRKIRKRDECIGKEQRRAKREDREPNLERCGA